MWWDGADEDSDRHSVARFRSSTGQCSYIHVCLTNLCTTQQHPAFFGRAPNLQWLSIQSDGARDHLGAFFHKLPDVRRISWDDATGIYILGGPSINGDTSSSPSWRVCPPRDVSHVHTCMFHASCNRLEPKIVCIAFFGLV